MIERAKGRANSTKKTGGSKAQLEAFARRLLEAEEQKIEFAGDQVYTDKQLDQILDRSVSAPSASHFFCGSRLRRVRHLSASLTFYIVLLAHFKATAFARKSLDSPKPKGKGRGKAGKDGAVGASAIVTLDEVLEKRPNKNGGGGDDEDDDDVADEFDIAGEIGMKELDHLG